MEKRTLLIGFCGNLLIALAGVVLCFRGLNHLAGVMLYLNKRERFPDGIDTWVMTNLSGSVQLFALLSGVLFILILFNICYLLGVMISKKTDTK